MKKDTFTFKDETGLDIFVYKWSPEGDIKGVLQIAHGMAETAFRYERLAEKLTTEGYLVYANDHRGHGKTAGVADNVGDLGEDGFNNMVSNLNQLQDIIKKENPTLPLFMLGHSMGSFLLQRYICLYGNQIDGAIFTGSSGKEGLLLDIGCFIAKRETKKLGRSGRSNTMNKLSFGDFNKRFKPNRTLFDWLSRDEKEVDKYIEDPFCGGIFTAGFFYDFSKGLKDVQNKKEIEKISKELPIYILSGTDDPVGKFGKGIKRLLKTYEKLGIKNLSYKLYNGARHEILNETNREEVMRDILNWLDQRSNNSYEFANS